MTASLARSSRLRCWLHGDQAILVVFGSHAIVVGFMLAWEQWVTGASGQLAVPWLWPLWFTAGGIATATYHTHRWSRRAWKASGALLVTAYTSRALAILGNRVTEELTVRHGVGATTWLLAAYCAANAWIRLVYPPVPGDRRAR